MKEQNLIKKKIVIDAGLGLITIIGILMAAIGSMYLFSWNNKSGLINAGQWIGMVSSVLAICFIGYRIWIIKQNRTVENTISSKFKNLFLFIRMMFYIIVVMMTAIGFNDNIKESSLFWWAIIVISLIPTFIVPGIIFILRQTGSLTKEASKKVTRSISDPKYDQAKVSELRAFAKKKDIKIPAGSKKEDIIKILKKR